MGSAVDGAQNQTSELRQLYGSSVGKLSIAIFDKTLVKSEGCSLYKVKAVNLEFEQIG